MISKNWWICLYILQLIEWTDDASSMPAKEVASMRETVRSMFLHGYDSYMEHAFPHDELKPLSKSFTDSLAELGNAPKAGEQYQGVAMTLIDALDSLAIMANKTEFQRAVKLISDTVSFDVDVRVNVFEANIRLLGGLLSAHVLASDKALELIENYDNGLLKLAVDLGNRLMPAFKSPSGIPFAWVNLQKGVLVDETGETCTAGVGTLLLEFGILSYESGNYSYYDAAYEGLMKLWDMRDPRTKLLGNTLDVRTGRWKNINAGIGAGIDSMYEYLFKSYLVFNNPKFLDMFHESYEAVMKHLRHGPWYFEASMVNGHPTHVQFNALQAFWPGLQVLSGRNLEDAIATQRAFFSLWERFGGLPERFLLANNMLHSTERHYPLRPELMESTYLLYRATRNPTYLENGKTMVQSLDKVSRVEAGYASVRDVQSGKLEDHMHSFFLAETCKYLYLLFDHDNFLHSRSDYVFTTEGHLFPVDQEIHERFRSREPGDPTVKDVDSPRTSNDILMPTLATIQATCELPKPDVVALETEATLFGTLAMTCLAWSNPNIVSDSIRVSSGDGAFFIETEGRETAVVRHLGTSAVEIVNRRGSEIRAWVVHHAHKASTYRVIIDSPFACKITIVAMGASFGPEPTKYDAEVHGLFIMSPDTGCTIPSEYKSQVENKIVLVNRGGCTFVEKAVLVKSLGARGLIVANHFEEDSIFMMGGDGTSRTVDLPLAIISGGDARRLRSCLRRHPQHNASVSLGAYVAGSEPESDDSHVEGTIERFDIVGIGGWRVRIAKTKDAYQLAIVRKPN